VTRLHRFFIIICLLVPLPFTALAESAASLWLQSGSQTERTAAVHLHTDIDIEVSGMLAYTLVTQRFVNNTSDWVEGRYLFPLPDGSAVESLRIRIGQRLIEGEIQERAQARQTYQQARSEGRAAGLVEQQPGNVFTTSVANIGPEDTVEIQIGFRQLVEFEHDRFSLRFPTTIAPRAGALASGPVPTVSHSASNQAGINPLSLQVELRPGMELASLESSHHSIQSDFDGDRWMIEVDGHFDEARRDFELIWRPARNSHAQSAVFRQQLGGLDHLLLMVVPPPEFSAQRTAREVVLIIDTSGSMRGEPMEQARESLLFALDRLGAHDRFNVIEFNHRTRPLFEQPQPASNARIAQARRFVFDLQAAGGTVMGPSLHLAMRDPVPDDYLRQIIFITDGLIANEQEVLSQIRRDIGQSRLFNVGIGHGVNSQFLRDGARFGRGSYTGIADLTQIHSRMSELLSQLTSPVLHDIELHWGGDVETFPERIPDLYAGQPLLVAARAEQLGSELMITAISDGRAWQQLIPLDHAQLSSGVAAHWARAGIQHWLDQRVRGMDPDQVRNGVLDLAVEYQLLSPFTSLVAVDRTPERTRQAALRRHELAANAPHGREMSESVQAAMARAMPSTDAGSEISILRGMLALLLIGLLLGHKRLARNPEEELEEEQP
jgi:Ca-activated chloride channel homolog